MTPESKVLKSIVRYLETLKKEGRAVWWVKLRAGPWQQAGLPDLLVVLGTLTPSGAPLLRSGRAIFLEVKAPGQKATALQLETMRRIRESGGVAEVVDSLDLAKEIIGW